MNPFNLSISFNPDDELELKKSINKQRMTVNEELAY